MKNLKVKSILFNLAAVLAIAICITACEQQGIVTSMQDQLTMNENQRILNALCTHHNDDCSGIEITDTAISIDNCSGFEKSDFLHYLDMLEEGYEPEPAVSVVPHPSNPGQMLETPIENVTYYDKNNQPILEERQRLYSWIRFVKNTKVSDIKYYIRPSLERDCKPGYPDSIHAAADYWNNIEGSKVNFSHTTIPGNADINIGCDTDDIFTGDYKDMEPYGAYSSFPSFGTRTPGKLMSFSDHYDDDYKIALAIHEFGHTLGFDHTDDNNGWHMYDTPINDSNSIMHSEFQVHEMSDDDLLAVRRLWPDQLKKPVNVSFEKVGGSVRIKLRNPDHINRPYNHINVGHVHNDVFRWGNWGHQPDDNGNYDIFWIKNFAPGFHSFYIQGASHNNEVIGGFSGWFHLYM